MYQMLRLTIVAMAVVFANFPTSAPARVAVTQIKLTEKHVEAFIAAQKDLSTVVEKMMRGAVFSNSANARYEAELKVVTNKHGFKNFAEYEAVAASISLVMAAIDSQTKVFTDPPTAIQQELEEVTAAKNIPNSEKKKLLRSLTLALRAARHIQFSTNIELVRRYYDKIYVTTIAAYDGDS
jgi:2-keto-4-pentenoate hydratase/2-oxohepta-3-ene-1,7-dioic acid hydratase in catechol pathway